MSPAAGQKSQEDLGAWKQESKKGLSPKKGVIEKMMTDYASLGVQKLRASIPVESRGVARAGSQKLSPKMGYSKPIFSMGRRGLL
jgi:hypothetical protein